MAGEQLRVTEGNERGTLVSVETDLVIGRLGLPEDTEGSAGISRCRTPARARLASGTIDGSGSEVSVGERIRSTANGLKLRGRSRSATS